MDTSVDMNMSMCMNLGISKMCEEIYDVLY